jgi:methyl-accepting chemotaxis protein
MKRLFVTLANSIRLQAVLSLIGLAALVTGVAVTGTLLVRGIDSDISNITDATEAMDALQKATDSMRVGRAHILLASQHDPALEISKLHEHALDTHLTKIEEMRVTGQKALQNLASKFPQASAVQELARTYEKIGSDSFAAAIVLFKEGKHQQAAALATATRVPGYTQYEKLADGIHDHVAGWIVTSRQSADQKAHLSVSVLTGASLVVLAVSLLYYLLAVRPILHRLGLLKNLAEQSARGALNIEHNPGRPDEIGIVIRAFNAMIVSYKTIIGKLLFESRILGDGSKQLLATSHTVAEESKRQANEVQAVAVAVDDLNNSMASVNEKSHATLEIAATAEERAGHGKELGSAAATNMESVGAAVHGASNAMQELTERSHAISGITASIKEIADQTNLLALNAAIEAARAGEAGRGFAVVADEVRKLAEKSASAAAEITNMLSAVQTDVDRSARAILSATQTAQNSANMAREMSDTLGQIQQGASATSGNVNDVALAVAKQVQATQIITTLTATIHEIAQSSQAQAQAIETEVRYIGTVAEGFTEIHRMFEIEKFSVDAMRLHEAMRNKAMETAQQVGRLFVEQIRAGRISENALFDEQYQAIPNTQPQKFSTQFDKLCDSVLTELQEAVLRTAPEIVYAIAIDRNSYVPTHNKRFSQPLTGDAKVDLAGNRTKRKFSDPVGQACGKSQLSYLLQTYRRDTGEIMHDMSAPVVVNGRHWGGFRIGYLPPT